MKSSLFPSYSATLLTMAVSLQLGSPVSAVDTATPNPAMDYYHRKVGKILGDHHISQFHIYPQTDQHLSDYALQPHIQGQVSAKHPEKLKLWSLKLTSTTPSSPSSKGKWFSSWWGTSSSAATPLSPVTIHPTSILTPSPSTVRPDFSASIIANEFLDVSRPSAFSPFSSTNPFRFNDGQYLGLPITGGGGRVLIGARLIERLERITGTPISAYFDYVGGTSAGGLGAYGLCLPNAQGKPLFGGGEMGSFLIDKFGIIFPDTSQDLLVKKLWCDAVSLYYPQYDSAPFETILKETFKDLTLGQSLTNVMALAVNTETDTPVILSNTLYPTLPTWQGARSTAAAPVKMELFNIPSIGILADGGLDHNAPDTDVLMQLRDLALKNSRPFDFSKVTFLSLGTGIRPVHSIPIDAGLLRAAAPVIETCIRTQEVATEMMMRSFLPSQNYIRLNPKLETDIPLDKLTPDIISQLTAAAETQFEAIEKFAQLEVVRKRLEMRTY